MKNTEMKVNLFVRWKPQRSNRGWGGLSIVTEVTEKSFKLRSLNDLSESDSLFMNNPIKFNRVIQSELDIVSLKEAQGYFEKSILKLRDTVERKKIELKDSQKEFETYKKRVETFFKTL